MMSSVARSIAALGAALACCGCRSSAHVAYGPVEALSNATELGTAPMFAVSPRGHEAAAWVSAPDGGSDASLYVSVDRAAPAVLHDSLGPIEPHGESPPKLAYGNDGTLYALYVVVRLIPGRRFPGAALRLTRSADGGHTWAPPETVTDDSVLFGSHNFHALHVAQDGAVYVSWLDGRNGKSAVYLTRSTDGGKTWGKNVRVSVREACPCCRTSIATAGNGVMYIAWRTVMPGNVRDIVVAKSTDGGMTWGEAHRVHADGWVFDGCPHAGPSLMLDARGRLHVAWWTGKEGAAGVWYARSDDGEHFGPAVALGVAAHSLPAHVQLALGPDDRVIATWDDGTARYPRVVSRVSNDGGATFGPEQVLSAGGTIGSFPVVAVRHDSVMVAWTSTPENAAPMSDAMEHGHDDKTTPRPLLTVGDARVMVRTGRLEGTQ
jgi:photosystem II stability/assembly factor-like uncharacterized protein